MAAGAIVGEAVHSMPSIGASVVGCLISTVGLGLCLTAVFIAKSNLATLVAEILSFNGVRYGFFHSLMTIAFESGNAATLSYGVYMGIISTAAILFIRRAHLKASRVS
jgi:hypothetical protein